MRKVTLLAHAAVLLLLLPAGSASALEITPNPIPLVGFGTLGTFIVADVELLDTVMGTPLGGVVSFGSIAPSDTSLVFRITLDASSGPLPVGFLVGASTAFGAFPLLSLSGAGVIPGPDDDVTLLSVPMDPSVAVTGLSPGLVSDLFFVAYPTPPAIGEVVWVGANDTSGSAALQTYGTVVPEPGSLGLLALGLAVLGHRGSRSTRT